MKTILFQGDSITDCGRDRNNTANVGNGYPLLVKSELGCIHPNEYIFENRGISGNRVVDLYARIKEHILNIKPDYVSILIGVNDVWHEIDWKSGVDAKKYEKIYSMLIEEIKDSLPETIIMILEPFCLLGTATQNTPEIPNKWECFSTEVKKRAEIAKIIAEKYNLKFVSLQYTFDEALKRAESSCWLADGVHPTAMGHRIIADEWLKAFNELNT